MDLKHVAHRIQSRYRRTASSALSRRLVRLRNTTPLISFTFDDFPKSALFTGGAILTRHSVVGTYYASLGLMGTEAPTGRIFTTEDLEILVRDGHELGCHTYDHCHSWETEPKVFEDSINKNRRALNEVLPGAVFSSLSYPIMCPRPATKRLAAQHFRCCRGSGGQTFNAVRTDSSHISAFFLEKSRDNPAAVKDLISQNSRMCGWLIFATHDVCDAPTRYGCTPQFFEEIVREALSSGARVLPVGRAWEACNVSEEDRQAGLANSLKSG
jgi:peptidoglycan/xylan/chitin deacetylase (PgdA/CDA1 family)